MIGTTKQLRDDALAPDPSKSVAAFAEAAPVPTSTFGAGARLADRFIIEGPPRRGGMGVVYRARDLLGGGFVAIKVMGRRSARRRQRFEREATILATQQHDAVVRYVAHGFLDDGAPWLAMEWLVGEDLSDRLRHKPLTFDESVRLICRVCDALADAHAQGIVHRDIKPSNLFLVDGVPEQVKVLDFGLSREAEPALQITRDGDRLGTVGYMAPEQASGSGPVDPRADVFSIACVLYECLVGHAPFESAHTVAVLAKVLRDEPTAPSQLRPDLPVSLDAFFVSALAKDPQARPRDAAQLCGALEHALLHGAAADLGPPTRMRGLEQKITSVILGRPEQLVEPPDSSLLGQVVTMDEHDLRFLSQNFSADASPLQGGALLLLLGERGEANDRAAQAAQCALALRHRRPELRLAIATGLTESSGLVPVGAAIDRAAELLEQAGRSHAPILVDELTAALIRNRFELEPVGVDQHALLGARPELEAPRKLMGKPTPCVGRDLELKLLDSALDECIAGSTSCAVLVTGPAGIGKSRLASEWLTGEPRNSGARILIARADPMSASAPLSLMQKLVRHASEVLDADSSALQHARLSDYLGTSSALQGAEFLSELLGLGEHFVPSPTLRAARVSPEIMREQTQRALEAWLAGEVARGPLVILIEDLHWCDARSVDMLTHALQQHAAHPLLVLALARPEAEQQFPQLCQRAALQLRLPSLSARAAERLVRAALHPTPSAEVIARVVRTAEGNAFFLEELIRRVASGSSDLPETIVAMAQSRLERLEAPARKVLRAASVFGETFWAEGVASALGTKVALTSELQGLVAREIIVQVASARYAGSHEYRFRHALLRDAAYQTLTDGDRERAHRAAGAWLAEVGEKEASLVAEHFAAGRAHAQAVPWLQRASRSALDLGDLQSAMAFAQQGLELGASGSERGLLLLCLGHVQTWSGKTDVAMLRPALDLLAPGSAPWWLTIALLTLAESAHGRPQEATHYVQLGLDAPPDIEQVGAFGQALLVLVGALVLLGRGELCAALIERARSVPLEAQEPGFLADLQAARCALASVAPIGGRWHLELAYRQGWDGVETMRSLGALCGEAMALNYFAVAATHLGRYDDAERACQRALSLAQHAGSGLNRDWAGVFLAKVQVRLGKSSAALATLEGLRASLDQNLLQMLPAIAAEALHLQQRHEEAIAEVEQAVVGPSPRLRRMVGGFRARALLALGRGEQAIAAAERALEEQTSSGLESEVELFASYAQALLEVGRGADARVAAQRAQALVMSVAETIADAELRRSFVEDVEPNARALRLASGFATASA